MHALGLARPNNTASDVYTDKVRHTRHNGNLHAGFTDDHNQVGKQQAQLLSYDLQETSIKELTK